MPSPIIVANTFANQSGNVPASQLDTNFAQFAAANNSLNTFNTYFVDSGSVNSIAIAIPTGLTVALTAGLTLQIKVAVTNTGATTITVGTLSAAALLTLTGSPLGAGAIVAGSVIQAQYDGANFYLANGIPSASGVTSITAGAGISVSAPTGAVTISTTSVNNSTTMTWVGYASPPSCTISWAIAGNVCVLNIGSFIAASTSSILQANLALPAAITPTLTAVQSLAMPSGSALSGGTAVTSWTAEITNGGALIFTPWVLYGGANPSGWATSGNKGLNTEVTFAYLLT